MNNLHCPHSILLMFKSLCQFHVHPFDLIILTMCDLVPSHPQHPVAFNPYLFNLSVCQIHLLYVAE